jgi:hypothetical protein
MLSSAQASMWQHIKHAQEPSKHARTIVSSKFQNVMDVVHTMCTAPSSKSYLPRVGKRTHTGGCVDDDAKVVSTAAVERLLARHSAIRHAHAHSQP